MGVGRRLDAGVDNPEIIEPARPLIKLIAMFYEELKVIEAGANLVKRFAGVAHMSDEAEEQSTLRLEKADVVHATVWRDEVVRRLHAQQFRVPGRTLIRIANS